MPKSQELAKHRRYQGNRLSFAEHQHSVTVLYVAGDIRRTNSQMPHIAPTNHHVRVLVLGDLAFPLRNVQVSETELLQTGI